MGDAVNAKGEEAGIGDDDFLERLGGGVIAQVAGGVFVEPFAHTAKAAEEGLGLLFGLRIADQAGNVGVQLDGCVHQTTAHVDHLQLVAHREHPREERAGDRLQFAFVERNPDRLRCKVVDQFKYLSKHGEKGGIVGGE